MKILMALLFLCAFKVNAANVTVAIIDSGVDIEHDIFKNKLWINAKEIPDNFRDDDGNTYPDDVYGWNFAESNNLVIDRKYLGTFSPDVYKFFELQKKKFLGTITEEEKNWANEKIKDKKFVAELNKFGNFVHGTHVAGITARMSDETKIMSIKLIPTEVKPFMQALAYQANLKSNGGGEDKRWDILKLALGKLAQTQMQMFDEIFGYVSKQGATIANGSFGSSYHQLRMITDAAYTVVFFKKPSDEDSVKAAKLFFEQSLALGAQAVKNSPNTLFVFAAGNDGSDNDVLPVQPANIKASNKISVAATFNHDALATFSNYGAENVDVAAPGVIITSSIPGNMQMEVSGTSQAAPFVAGLAAKIKAANEKLTPEEIKQILMGTVDKKVFLVGKVKSGGIVNVERASTAADLTKNTSVSEAIKIAGERISDVKSTGIKTIPHVTPIALTPLFVE